MGNRPWKWDDFRTSVNRYFDSMFQIYAVTGHPNNSKSVRTATFVFREIVNTILDEQSVQLPDFELDENRLPILDSLDGSELAKLMTISFMPCIIDTVSNIMKNNGTTVQRDLQEFFGWAQFTTNDMKHLFRIVTSREVYTSSKFKFQFRVYYDEILDPFKYLDIVNNDKFYVPMKGGKQKRNPYWKTCLKNIGYGLYNIDADLSTERHNAELISNYNIGVTDTKTLNTKIYSEIHLENPEDCLCLYQIAKNIDRFRS